MRVTKIGITTCRCTWMRSRIKKYVLATLRNCSKRLSGKKEIMLYLEVVTTLFCVQRYTNIIYNIMINVYMYIHAHIKLYTCIEAYCIFEGLVLNTIIRIYLSAFFN